MSIQKRKEKEALHNPDEFEFEVMRKRKRNRCKDEKVLKAREICFILHDLQLAKKKVEELIVSQHLRSHLPADDWKRQQTSINLEESKLRVEELRSQYEKSTLDKELMEKEKMCNTRPVYKWRPKKGKSEH
ncbi:putative U3 small nucleolar RNA-associated protein 11 [Abeliophyllum distichum]|uniref:U3 small nucleolar RNA-associated protein 11 n=1 Tax=Abeliophyllum distichum TaxID=126358 RepID=A0ABD1NRS8_9LAMI